MNRASRQPFQQQYRDLLASSHQQLWQMLTRSYEAIDTLYEEHLRVIALLANLALGLQYSCGLYQLPPERRQSQEWSHLVVIDLPGGQLCWPVPDHKIVYFRDLPLYRGVWRGMPRLDNQWRLLLNPHLPYQPYPTEKMASVPLPPR
jgi:hypothetical protein